MTFSDSSHTPSHSHSTRLQGRRLALWRGFWLLSVVIIAFLALVTYVTLYHDLSRTPSRMTELGLSPSMANVFRFSLELFTMLAYWLMAGIVFWRRNDDRMAILLSVGLFIGGLRLTAFNYVSFSMVEIWHRVSIGISAVLIVTMLAQFPDGRYVPRWLRFIPYLYALHSIDWSLRIPNFHLTYFLFFDASFFVLLGAAQVYRYGRLPRLQRQQVKWFIVGLVILFTAFYFERSIPIGNGAVFILVRLLYLALPISLAFAILRYRLYEVDLVLNRGLVYGALSAFLGVVFVVGAFLVNLVLGQLLPAGMGTTLGALVAVLFIGALFNPVRRWLQHWVDTRLFRLRFDLNRLAELRQEGAKLGLGALNGQTLGGFSLQGLIGRGGMGEVYRALRGSTPVAVKVLPPEALPSDESIQRFEREAQLAQSLVHPHIVRVTGYGEQEGIRWMAMDYIAGETLSTILRAQGKLNLEQVRFIIQDVASALDYIHGRGIIHRDIKPANIMVYEERALLMDFGLARQQQESLDLTQSGLVGTLEYTAPEQIQSSRDVDYRADIYALGALAYALLAGTPPFKGTVGQVVFAHLYQPAPDLRLLLPDLPLESAQAVQRALAKNPAERFSSAGAFAQAL